MRIHIKSGRIRLFFALPLSFVKSRLASRIFTDAVKSKSTSDKDDKHIEANGDISEETSETPDLVTIINAEKDAEVSYVAQTAAVPCDAKSDFAVNRAFMKNVYGALKKIVKEKGHFTLIDVTADNEKTKVIIGI